MARLPTLENLRVRAAAPLSSADVVLELAALRRQPLVDVLPFRGAAALFLGAAVGGTVQKLRLVGGRVLDVCQLRRCRDLGALEQALLSPSDVDVLYSVCSFNPFLDPAETLEQLRARERALARTTVRTFEAEMLLEHAVQAVMQEQAANAPPTNVPANITS